MAAVLWDASALVKRYAPETGSDVVNALFDRVPRRDMVVTTLGYAETFSSLLRQHNGGAIGRVSFETAVTALEAEFIDDAEVTMLSLDDASILGGLSLMRRHNINASDAAILRVYLRYRQSRPDMPMCVLASDKRLVRAAHAERLAVLDPETASVDQVAAFTADC
jgi:hypothetical protein